MVVEPVMKVLCIMSSFGSFGRMKNNTTHSPGYIVSVRC